MYKNQTIRVVRGHTRYKAYIACNIGVRVFVFSLVLALFEAQLLKPPLTCCCLGVHSAALDSLSAVQL